MEELVRKVSYIICSSVFSSSVSSVSSCSVSHMIEKGPGVTRQLTPVPFQRRNKSAISRRLGKREFESKRYIPPNV